MQIAKHLNISKFLTFLLIAGLCFSQTACKDDDSGRGGDPDNPYGEFYLYLDYWNPTGNDPQIVFDETLSSPEVVIDFTKTFEAENIPPNIVDVLIDNIRIIDDAGDNYQIQDVDAYEYREDNWELDVEFTVFYELVEEMSAFLILDASNSLGDDFATIKEYAQAFVTQVFESIPDTKLGVIDFSNEIGLFQLSDSPDDINNYIESIPQGQFTSLYDAVNLGIEQLNFSDSESKAIMTFTDGIDNNSDPALNPNLLLDKMENNPDGSKIISYTIGFKGNNANVDEAALETIACNGGLAEFPQSLTQLEQVFKDFSESISTVYTLRYRRNQQPIQETDKRSLKFVISAEKR